ncbi:hypothetical protein N8198_06860 [Gammaproteobacteria bacterium]|nr:hypothetical protein [Gammaproteobacteria bacterium]
MRSHGGQPGKIVTGKLSSYPVAHREIMSGAIHEADRGMPIIVNASEIPIRGRYPATRCCSSWPTAFPTSAQRRLARLRRG